MTLREQLQDLYAEQQVLVAQQQELLAEVDRLYREQAQLAVTDAITGLPNHRAIMSRLEEEVSYCQRTEHSCAILFVDLDHFKRINDTWGHRAGDTILHEVGARLRATLRLEDVVGRYGGEEFAIILPGLGVGDLDNVKQVAERLRAAVANKPCFWEVENMQEIVPITVTTSIGVAVYQLHGVTREELIEHADHAMYQAKHSGRNCVCVADVETLPAIGSNGHKDSDGLSRDVEVSVAGTLQILMAVVSAHDRNTNEHVHRMVKLAEATAQKLQQPEEELHLIRLAALFHDIGKVGIPDAILHKPGPLTSEEWVVMRRHPEIGRHILAQAGGIFEQLSHIVVAHHERWDGKGYPAGLAGEDIPISARIITVVDSYDAMISPRPYREPLSVEAARAELLRCAGSQYDPQVVEAFLSALGEPAPTAYSFRFRHSPPFG
jgi:diguanylate cyclase (GGDEF)-like protein